jgi:hypothetical protein
VDVLSYQKKKPWAERKQRSLFEALAQSHFAGQV